MNDIDDQDDHCDSDDLIVHLPAEPPQPQRPTAGAALAEAALDAVLSPEVEALIGSDP